MGQVLLITFVIVFFSRWLDARFPAPAKPAKPPKPKRVYKQWERWWMGLGALAPAAILIPASIAVGPQSLFVAPIFAIVIVIAAYRALTPIPPITSRQWWIIGISLVVFFFGALVICPPVGVFVPLVALAAIGMYSICSEVQGEPEGTSWVWLHGFPGSC